MRKFLHKVICGLPPFSWFELHSFRQDVEWRDSQIGIFERENARLGSLISDLYEEKVSLEKQIKHLVDRNDRDRQKSVELREELDTATRQLSTLRGHVDSLANHVKDQRSHEG